MKLRGALPVALLVLYFVRKLEITNEALPVLYCTRMKCSTTMMAITKSHSAPVRRLPGTCGWRTAEVVSVTAELSCIALEPCTCYAVWASWHHHHHGCPHLTVLPNCLYISSFLKSWVPPSTPCRPADSRLRPRQPAYPGELMALVQYKYSTVPVCTTTPISGYLAGVLGIYIYPLLVYISSK